MKSLKCSGWLTILLLTGLLWMAACESDIDPIDGDQSNNSSNPTDPVTYDPDEISEYLVLDNATKINGTLPTAPDGQLKIDARDTIFLVKGYRLGSRIRVLHDSTQDVSGFNIHLSGASFYYDVPEDIVEGQYVAQGEGDTTSVLELDIDLPEDDVEYPYTAEVIIQPHGPSGQLFDEFSRYITIEDPESGENCNSIVEKTWEWNFTLRVNNGDITSVWAPGLGIPINTTGGGCCGGEGKSYTVTDPQCVADIQEPNMKWIKVYPNDYYVRPFEILHFYDGGKALAFQKEVIKNWDLFNTDFCSKALAYTFTVNDNFAREGEHDFTPGASYMRLNFPDWKGGWRPLGGDIVYTCNVLVIVSGSEGDAFLAVYKQWDGFSMIENTQVIWHD